MWIRSLVVLSSFALVLQVSDTAHAGPVEQLVQIALHPTQSDVMVLRYKDGGDGLFYSRDGGKSWALQCLSAMAPMVNNAGPIAVAGSGQVLMGVFEGLFQDDGKGCDWTQDADVDQWISDIVPHPTDPGVMFAVTSTGGMAAMNGILKRDADGKVTDFAPKEELLISRLRVVQNGSKLRFYESVLKGTVKKVVDGMEVDVPNYLVRYSDDDAKTFTEFPFDTPSGSLRLHAVDPSNPDRLVVVVDRESKDDEILVSSDRGEHFESYMMLSQFGGLVFTATGKIFIGEAGFSTITTSKRALWVADSLDSPPTMLANYPVQCLAYQASTDSVFACQYRQFGTIDKQSGAFTSAFTFTGVKDFVSCEGEPTDMACQQQLCADYCTFGHFASAPVCNAYTGPNCGPCAAKIDSGEPLTAECKDPPSGTAGGAASAGTSGGGGGSTSSSAGRSAMGSAGRSPSTAGTGGGGTSGSDSDSDSGCACSSVGQQGPGAALSAVFATLGLLLVGRRRRRPRSQRHV